MADKVITLHPQNQTDDNLYPRVLGKAEVANRDGNGNVIAKTYALKSIAPELPSSSKDGTYVLKAVKSGNTITYSWVLEA